MRVLLLFSALALLSSCACKSERSLNQDPETNMNVPEIIQYYGYPYEGHDVTTEDGYILSLQRIPYGLKNRESPRPVVLLQHGLLDSSFTYITNGPEKSLAFYLADNGYDVWLSNSRGNLFSKRHTKFSSTSRDFWDFTWDDMASQDLPACIEYIVSTTKVAKIGYVGHSQGTEIGFAQFSKQTKLNEKVSAFVALAPVAYMGHCTSPITLILPFMGGINMAANLLTGGEFAPNIKIMNILQKAVCGTNLGSTMCGNLLFLLVGTNTASLNASRLPIMLSHLPAGTSSKNMNHYAQSFYSNKFQYYDYGMFGNLRRYGQTSTPLYKLGGSGLPIAMFWGGNDILSVPQDVNRTLRELGDDVKFQKYLPSYNHMDFMWGINAVNDVFPDILSFLNQYNE